MVSSSTLKAAWAALREEEAGHAGVYERRVFAHSGFDLFAGISRPTMLPRLSIVVPNGIDTESLERETRGFKVLRHIEPEEEATAVTLELTNHSFREVFEVVSEDVVMRVLKATTLPNAIAAMRARLNHWERFMLAAGPDGLSREAQIGLFGEVTFLKTLLDAAIPGDVAVAWWKGPAHANQDFVAGRRAVEVKTTTSNSSTAVRISNELQLDDTDNEELYLLHLWLRAAEGSGTSLPQLVDSISSALTDLAATSFIDRLGQVGYHDMHRRLYIGTGYTERSRHYYLVNGIFPRIRQAELRPGVTEVKYWIDLAGYEAWRRDEMRVVRALAEEAL